MMDRSDESDANGIRTCDISVITTSNAKTIITREILSRRWNIGPNAAARTLEATMQCGIKHFLHPLKNGIQHQIYNYLTLSL
jgi:hypothetical protein